VIVDSGIIFAPSKDTPLEALELVRAKEQVQAALAVVAARKVREDLERRAREAAPGSASGDDATSSEAVGEASEATNAECPASSDEDITIRNMRARARERRPLLLVRKGRGMATRSQR
jgi:hypothetical protein